MRNVRKIQEDVFEGHFMRKMTSFGSGTRKSTGMSWSRIRSSQCCCQRRIAAPKTCRTYGHREDLENIANPELKQHHIEIAQDLAEQRAETVQLFETGQITRDQMGSAHA